MKESRLRELLSPDTSFNYIVIINPLISVESWFDRWKRTSNTQLLFWMMATLPVSVASCTVLVTILPIYFIGSIRPFLYFAWSVRYQLTCMHESRVA
jgi:hypothetical protein